MTPAVSDRTAAIGLVAAKAALGAIAIGLGFGLCVLLNWPLITVPVVILIGWVARLEIRHDTKDERIDAAADVADRAYGLAAEAHVMAYEHTHPEPDDQPVIADPETPDVVEGLAGEVIAHDPGPATQPEMPAQPGPETTPMHRAWDDSAAELDGRIADIELARALAELEDRIWQWKHKEVAA